MIEFKQIEVIFDKKNYLIEKKRDEKNWFINRKNGSKLVLFLFFYSRNPANDQFSDLRIFFFNSSI